MSSPPKTTAFLQVLSSSELLDSHQMNAVMDWLDAQRPVGRPAGRQSRTVTTASAQPLQIFESPADPKRICDWLLAQSWITAWQAEKLLQGKHRGFQLGPYVLQDKIARGGMSTIYAGRHQISGQLHALKVLPLSKTHKASYLPRFKREAELAGRLIHPNIVRVFQIHHEHDGRNDVYFMAMELLPGRDLYDLVNEQGPLPCRTAAEYIRQAAMGLQFAHDAGLVHRDVKPGNLFLHDDGHVRLLDLGLANDFECDDGLTRDYNERILGTADYLSPEQAIDSHLADVRSDVYSLGCTFYFLLTGHPPFHGGTLAERILAHQSRTPDPVGEFRDDVPPPLTDLLKAMMQKQRDQRIPSAAAVVQELETWLASVVDDARFDARPLLHRQGERQTPDARGGDAMQLGEHADQQHAVPSVPSPAQPVAVRRQADSPTDSLRSCRPLTTPPESRLKPVSTSPYLPEFQKFLRFLSQQMGVHTVLTEQASQAHLETVIESLPEVSDAATPDLPEAQESEIPVDSIATPAADQHDSTAANNSVNDSTSAATAPEHDLLISDDLRALALLSIRQELAITSQPDTTSRVTAAHSTTGTRSTWLQPIHILMTLVLLLIVCSAAAWLLFPEPRDELLRWTTEYFSGIFS